MLQSMLKQKHEHILELELQIAELTRDLKASQDTVKQLKADIKELGSARQAEPKPQRAKVQEPAEAVEVVEVESDPAPKKSQYQLKKEREARRKAQQEAATETEDLDADRDRPLEEAPADVPEKPARPTRRKAPAAVTEDAPVRPTRSKRPTRGQ